MSLKNLEAALLQLSAQATEHYAAIELIINNPVAISGHTDLVGEIVRRAKLLAECEDAYSIAHKHFIQTPREAAAQEAIDETTEHKND